MDQGRQADDPSMSQAQVEKAAAEREAADATTTASVMAGQAREAATERSYVLSRLRATRETVSNYAFGFYMLLAVICAALVVWAVAFYFRSPSPNTTVTAADGSTVTTSGR